jgi:hypothetical protein
LGVDVSLHLRLSPLVNPFVSYTDKMEEFVGILPYGLTIRFHFGIADETITTFDFDRDDFVLLKLLKFCLIAIFINLLGAFNESFGIKTNWFGYNLHVKPP